MGEFLDHIESREPSSVMGHPLVQKFIKSRGIKQEDFSIIEALAKFPKDLIIMELHNMFNLGQHNSGKELEGLIDRATDENKKTLYRLALDFYNKYDWGVAINLVRLLEDL